MNTNTNMVITTATKNDLPSILEIVADARELIESLNFNQWTKESGYPGIDDFVNDLNNMALYVLKTSNYVIGMMALYQGSDENYSYIDGKWLTETDNYLTIHRLAIKKEYYGTKAGQELINYAFKQAQAKKVPVRIDTHKKNIPMNKLALKMGFSLCGTIYIKREKIEPERNAYERMF